MFAKLKREQLKMIARSGRINNEVILVHSLALNAPYRETEFRLAREVFLLQIHEDKACQFRHHCLDQF